MTQAPAGWYPHPTMTGTQAYWDGGTWTTHVAPLATAVVVEPQKASGGVVLIGVLCAFLIPFVGLLIGLSQINKRGSDGIVIVVFSIIGFALWYSALT